MKNRKKGWGKQAVRNPRRCPPPPSKVCDGNRTAGMRRVFPSGMADGMLYLLSFHQCSLMFYIQCHYFTMSKTQLLFCCRVLFEIHAQSRAPGACQYRQPHALLPLPWSCFVCLLMLSFISNLISITIKTCLAFTLLHVQLITTNCKGIKHVFYRNIFPHFKGEKKEDRIEN